MKIFKFNLYPPKTKTMKKLALGVLFSLFISFGPAVNAMVLVNNGTEVKNLPDGDKDKKKKKKCDSSNKEGCNKEKKKSCCTDKSKEGMKDEPKK
jgi:hypothetical protein